MVEAGEEQEPAATSLSLPSSCFRFQPCLIPGYTIEFPKYLECQLDVELYYLLATFLLLLEKVLWV